MMSLKSYYRKNVSIIDSNGQLFIGIVDDYFFPEDNESRMESIVIKTMSGELYEFTENAIETIIII